MTFGVILLPNPRSKKNSTYYQINPRTSDENKNSEICTIKTLLDKSSSVSIVRKTYYTDVTKFSKIKKNKWSTIAGIFNTTFVTEIILKFEELNRSAEIYAKCNLSDILLNYDLILSRDIPHELGIIVNFDNKTITWQEVSISIKNIKLYGKRILSNQRKSPS